LTLTIRLRVKFGAPDKIRIFTKIKCKLSAFAGNKSSSPAKAQKNYDSFGYFGDASRFLRLSGTPLP
jgi:hypothetical protein